MQKRRDWERKKQLATNGSVFQVPAGSLSDIYDISEVFGYDKETKQFTVELSDYKELRITNSLILRNPETNGRVMFTLVKIDKDGSDEDIHGWRYEGSVNGEKLKLLIIND